jgi:two-component system response regulator AtoC
MLGQCGAIAEVLDEARVMSAADCNVLLTGESGAGKGLLAQFIHESSPRRRRRMLSRSCAGAAQSRLEAELLGDGLFEKAHRSTLLLAGVGEMSPRIQALLRRVIESGDARDVRIVSSTTRDLLQPVSEPAFCAALYYRLNVAHLQIPPLRARPEDIAFLMGYYLRMLSEEFRLPMCDLDPGALAMLEAYSWPGNLRELREVAQVLALKHAGRVVGADDLPETVLTQRGPRPPIAAAPGRFSVARVARRTSLARRPAPLRQTQPHGS